jgi:aspartate/glutamate racemase
VVTGDFYVPLLKERYTLDIVVPENQDTESVDSVMFRELGKVW